MDFQNYASTEASKLITQLLTAQSGGGLQQLAIVRDALDAAARALAAPAHLDQDIRDLVGKLTSAADAEVRRVREESDTAIGTMIAEMQVRQAEIDSLTATLARSEAEAALLRNDLAAATERADQTERDLTDTVEAHAEIERSLRKLESELKQATQARAAVEKELAHAHATLQQLLADIEQLRARLDKQIGDTSALQAQVRDLEDQRDGLSIQRDGLASQRDVLTGQLDAAARRVSALESELTTLRAVREHRDALVAQLDSGTARIITLEDEVAKIRGALEGELANSRSVVENRDAIAVQLEVTSARVRTLEQELAQALEARERNDAGRVRALEQQLAQAIETREQREALAAQIEASHTHARTLEEANAKHEEQIRQLTIRLDEALQSEARLQEKLTSRTADPSPDQPEVDVLRGEVDRMVSLLDASARAVTEMAAAKTSTDLLNELLKRLSLQFSRVALFRIKGNRLEGDNQIGFDDPGIAKLAFAVTADSILTRSLNSSAVEVLTGDDVAARTGTPFGGAPRTALALPIALQGSTMAIVYADDADMPEGARGQAVQESSIGFARLLVGQVGVLLLRHSHELKTHAELAQYATTLLQEAKEMYLADAQAGKNPDLLRSRLKDNLECASQLYTYRAAMEGTAAASLLDEQILAEIDSDTPFAKDLAAVLNQMTAGELQITAEAS